jgi:chromosome segregation ATPase
MIEVLAVALLVGTALLLATRLDDRRSVEPDGPHPIATAALAAEQKRLADLKTELAAAETRTAERERQISVKLRELTAAERERTEAATELANQEAALAQRERDLERSLADAERSAPEATAQIEYVGRPETQMDWRESDWWEKQLGRPLSAKK